MGQFFLTIFFCFSLFCAEFFSSLNGIIRNKQYMYVYLDLFHNYYIGNKF